MEKTYPTIAERDQLRKANHEYYGEVAELLNDGGVTQKMLLEGLKEYGDTPNTKDSIKDIYRNIGKQMYGITSTQELTTIQAKEVERVFTDAIQVTQRVTLPDFPSEESLQAKQRGWHR